MSGWCYYSQNISCDFINTAITVLYVYLSIVFVRKGCYSATQALHTTAVYIQLIWQHSRPPYCISASLSQPQVNFQAFRQVKHSVFVHTLWNLYYICFYIIKVNWLRMRLNYVGEFSHLMTVSVYPYSHYWYIW